MLKLENDLIKDLITVINDNYDYDVAMSIEPTLLDEEGNIVYGCTTFCEDGSIIISLNANTAYVDLLEIIAHEFAHVVVGIEVDHNEAWEKEFDKIHSLYNEYVSKKHEKDEVVEVDSTEGVMLSVQEAYLIDKLLKQRDYHNQMNLQNESCKQEHQRIIKTRLKLKEYIENNEIKYNFIRRKL